ncbi:MAG: helix-turn-helix domain-containing protein [Promethearchaeota archaeon]
MKSKDFYTTTELAKILKISRIAVFNKIKKGEIKAQKMGRNFVIFKKDLKDIDVNLFKFAEDWVSSKKKFPEEFYCQNSSTFQARVSKMEILINQRKKNKKLSPLLTSIAGEIGNNSFDHNLGQWLDIPGIFFGYNLNKQRIVLADRGVGILKTLKRVKPELKNHKESLLTAFTEVISGRKPEARGNGLKYVRKIISKYPINLIFQTGNARLTLKGGNQDINIQIISNDIKGCLALITY